MKFKYTLKFNYYHAKHDALIASLTDETDDTSEIFKAYQEVYHYLQGRKNADVQTYCVITVTNANGRILQEKTIKSYIPKEVNYGKG